MKILVVGGVAGGASAAARIRRLDEEAEIIIFERGEHVSYSNCALPYYLGGVVPKRESLVLMTPEAFKSRHDIEVRTGSEVISIDRAAKTVTVRTSGGEEYRESYDKLILAPGADPVLPRSIKGIDREKVFTLRNVTDAGKIKDYMDAVKAKTAVVTGGGFIGIEVAENLREAGLKVSLVEGLEQIMSPFDYDMVQFLHKELLDNGVDLYLSGMVSEITDTGVRFTKDGAEKEISADVVVMCVGVSPASGLVQAAGLEVNQRRFIRVNHNYQTSDPDIYAVGDAVESYNRLSRSYGNLALAGPAQRQARAAADHICGAKHNNRGYIGSSCLQVFGLNAACTGLSEKTAKTLGIPCEIAYVLPSDKVSLMPGSSYMAFKLVFEVPTGRILGAQAIGRGDAVRRIDVIAAMISMEGTLEDLKELELCYAPVYGTAKDVVNLAALVGLNVLYGDMPQVHVSEVRGLVESGAYIIDVREPAEYAAGHLKGSMNIPLSQFRQRIDEVPRDRPVYLHCRSSQRSYYALCELRGRGWRNMINISGSFLGICLYEYFNDVTTGREPIVTAYNFN